MADTAMPPVAFTKGPSERTHPGSAANIAAMSAPSPQAMRFATAAFATGVVLIAAEVDGVPVGMLVNSFTSVSLDPPLVSVNIARTSGTWPLLRRAGRWGISILGAQQGTDFRRLSRKATERFQGVDWFASRDGGVLLAGASATFTVSMEAEVDAGDHVVVILRVLGLHRTPDRTSLVFYDSQPHRLAAAGEGGPDTGFTSRGLS
jgi:flavin reductase (DIM6/NTAB) family NADH-FMN oxidoreductase RutF